MPLMECMKNDGSLYEKYVVNSVTVTKNLDMRQPVGDVYKRRADLHGLSLTVAVNPMLTLYGVKGESVVIYFLVNQNVIAINCVFNFSQKANLNLASKTCFT